MNILIKSAKIALISIFASFPVIAQSWSTVGGSCFSAGPCQAPSVIITPSGEPHVLYRDDSFSQTANVQKFVGGSWNYVGTLGFSDCVIMFPSLAINSSGTPIAAYLGIPPPHPHGTMVRTFDGSTTWTIVDTVAAITMAQYVSLAIGTGDSIFVAYRDDSITMDWPASVRKFDGSNWVYVGPRRFTPGGASFTSLAADAAGTLYLAYVDHANGRKASVMKFTSGVWTNVGVAGFSPGVASNTTLAIDAGGTPYVSFQDSANAAKLTVMKYDGTAWITVGPAGFTDGAAEVGARYLSIDPSDNPCVAYADGANGNKATLKKYNGTSWTTVGSAGFSPGAARDVTLAISASGVPYVVFGDATDNYRARMMMYDVPTEVHSTALQAGRLCVYPNPATNDITISAPYPIMSVSITDVLGRTVFSKQYNTQQVQVDVSAIPSGQYFISANNNDYVRLVKE